jgi:hypothetical protein
MNARHRCGILSLVSGAVLLCACAREHSEALSPHVRTAGEGAGGQAGEGAAAAGGKAGAAATPRNPPKPGKSGVPGAKAVAALEAVGDAAQDSANAIRGTATFTVTESGVDLAILLQRCPKSGTLQLFIQDGGDCSDETLSGPHWDSPRGEGIPIVTCLGVSAQGRVALTRTPDAETSWSIGDSTKSDVLMHAVVVYDAASGTPLACGVVMNDMSARLPTAQDSEATRDVPLLARAQIAGLCTGQSIVRNNTQDCPDPTALNACAQEHCQLDACVATCADYLACTSKAEDPCSVAFTCAIDEPCATCHGAVQMCAFSFCADQLTCAAPTTPDGPCSQLEACCGLQGDMAPSCLETVQLVEKISGDPSCFGLMRDWDFFSHLPVPCMFE